MTDAPIKSLTKKIIARCFLIVRLIFASKLDRLAYKYKTDKTPLINHNYTSTYRKLFKNSGIKKLLEIGIGHSNKGVCGYMGNNDYKFGASLYMWRDYFPKARIFGCDIIKEIIFNDNRINCFYCDQSNKDSLMELANKTGKDLDVIIDDGSHITEHQIVSAKTLLPFVVSGGYYIIEDVLEADKIIKSLPGYNCEIVTCSEKRIDDKLIIIRKK